jgi:poly(3-hydroxybutyrate) depolymerase
MSREPLMIRHNLPLPFLIVTLVIACARVPSAQAEPPAGISADDAKQLDRDLAKLGERLVTLKREPITPERADLVADVEVFHKGVVWALKYETKLTPADVALIKKAIARGTERADALAAGKPTWSNRKGKVVRGYASAVDGSAQPFGLIVPAEYDPAKPARLDVVLHGSTKPIGLSELRFMNRFDEGDGSAKSAPETNYIELHPLGRVENCYRWAGETDVFEAIEAICRRYKIDRDRIVLRGMSMGASGTWHLGLKHPDRFVALGPYCGYVDTHEFSKTPLDNFVKIGPLPEHQEKALHMLDSIDYAANAGVVPAIACMGEKDVFFQAHVLMGNAMEREGFTMVNLISPGTGHVIDPKTHAEQMRRIEEFADKGLDRSPKHVRFVTWTLKYNENHWLRILGLGEHYVRAELEASIDDDGTVDVKEPKNVTRFALLPPVLQGANRKLRVGGREVMLPRGENSSPSRPVIGQKDGKWTYLGQLDTMQLDGKTPGVQGPIDDAFTTPFLCVRGTSRAWNPTVQSWANASLKRFAYEWHRYFRGELPVKNDTAVTDEDIKRCNLILFGDPGSNCLMARVLPRLPLQWSEKELTFGKNRYPATDHVPSMIQPNPLAPGRYVVFNSGHTFHEKELASLNYLLFPRLGDWAILKVGAKSPANPSEPLDEEVIRAGFFDERWLLP